MAGSKPLTIDRFLGVRNDVPAEDMRLASEAGTDLVAAVNVDINDAGAPQRRAGYTDRAAGTDMHSLYASKDGKIVLVVDGSAMYRVLDGGASLAQIGSGLTPGARMSYWPVQGRVYMSNGHETAVLDAGLLRTWGVRRPADVAALPAPAAGMLMPGRYGVLTTYRCGNVGPESGAGAGTEVVLTERGGITVGIVASTNPSVTHVNVYATTADGAMYFHVATVPNATGPYTIEGLPAQQQRPLITQHFDKPPAGQAIAAYRGRMYIARGRTLHWTSPFGMELARPLDSAQLEGEIRLLAPTEDGIYVSDDRGTFFFAGNDPSSFDVTRVGEPAVPGSLAYAPAARIGQGGRPIEVPVWLAADGVAVGAPGGAVTLTNPNFRPDAAATAAGVVRESDGTFQYLASTGV